MDTPSLRLIFGLKVRLLRQAKELTLQQLTDKTGVALSYLHDIENGKKHPSLEKIMSLAQALDTPFEVLVAPRGMRRLDPVIDLLESDFFQTYPLEVFGLQPGQIIESMAKAPEKLGAFISTVVKITRSYHLTRESLNVTALRSYQDLHDNYFPHIESAARSFRQQHGFVNESMLKVSELEHLLKTQFGIVTDRATLAREPQLSGIRSYYQPEKRILYLNQSLSSAQECFLIGRELGFQCLSISDKRPFETSVLQTENFETLLHNFQASYFASALSMEEGHFAESLRKRAQNPVWDTQDWLRLLSEYNVTAEMLLQRMTNILPAHFGLKDLFFIRIQGDTDTNQYEMTKELHLNGLQSPYRNAYGASYCHRWLSIDIIKRLSEQRQGNLLAAAQLSEYWQTPNQYLCISMAKQDARSSHKGVSVTIGVRVSDALRNSFRFLQDPALPHLSVNTTCENCGIANCLVRAAPPSEIEAEEKLKRIQLRLKQL